MNIRCADPAATPLVKEKLYLLGGVVEIDDRISWRNSQDRGLFEPFNVYLLKEGDDVLLVEGGVAINELAVSSQIASVLGDEAVIKRLAVTRNEPDCISNIPSLARHWRLQTVHTPGVMNPLDFFDDVSSELQMLSFGVEQVPMRAGGMIRLGQTRRLDALQTPLRILSTIWYYDTGTKALFTSDVFSDEASRDGLVKVVDRALGIEDVSRQMRDHLAVKFDWLRGGRIEPLIAGLESILNQNEIDILAPSRGCVIQGREAVDERIAALLRALRQLGSM